VNVPGPGSNTQVVDVGSQTQYVLSPLARKIFPLTGSTPEAIS
jgi:hypothetical protein